LPNNTSILTILTFSYNVRTRRQLCLTFHDNLGMHISRQSKSFRASLAKQLEAKLSEVDSNDDNELNVSEVVAFGKDLKMNREQRDTLLGTLLNPAESPKSELGNLSHNLNTFLGTLAGPAQPPQSESVKYFYQLHTSGSASRLSMLAKAESSPRNYLTLSGNILDDLRASGNTKAKEIIESAEVGALAFEFGEMLKDALSSVPLEDGHLTPTALNALAKKVFGNDADEDLLNTFISTALAPVEDKEGYWTLATVNGAQARVQMHLDHFANDADPDNRLADMMRSAHARVNEAALLFGPDVTLGKIAATSVQLQKDIKGLEAANKAKMGEIDRLVRDIESRKADLKREYNNKRNIGIFAIFAGVPALGALSLIEMQRDDARLNSQTPHQNSSLIKPSSRKSLANSTLSRHENPSVHCLKRPPQPSKQHSVDLKITQWPKAKRTFSKKRSLFSHHFVTKPKRSVSTSTLCLLR